GHRYFQKVRPDRERRRRRSVGASGGDSPRHRPGAVASRRRPQAHFARERDADARSSHERTQEIRSTGRSQALPVLEALNEKQIARASPGLHNPGLVAFHDMNKTKIAVVGASGYAGEELIRLLLR